MENSMQKLFRKDIVALEAYKSARSIGGSGTILLNANEFPSPNIYSIQNIELNRYPECQPIDLLNRYASYVNIDCENILVSRGSDEGIELLMRVCCIPNQDTILTFSPTYTMYSKIAEIYGIKHIDIPLIDNTSFNILEIKKHLYKVKLIYICRPNNPTGHLFNLDEIIELLELTLNKSILVIDEAYIEFCIDENIVFLLKRFNNLVILRTLSKAFGLAGIRCGFTLAHKDIIRLLQKVITPYPLAAPSIDIAVQALSYSGILDMKNKISILKENKVWLLNNLKRIHLIKYIFDSATNYVLVHFFNSNYVFNTLWNKGIILRKQDHIRGLKECIRISIGTKKECSQLIHELKEIALNLPQ